MRSYTKHAPVIALDDRGAGRRFAHVAIFSLPTVEGYGGNFNGTRYLPLDRAVRDAASCSAAKHGKLRDVGEVVEVDGVVVSFGGSDPHNLTGRVTESLNRIGIRPVVVYGPLFKHEAPDGDYVLVDRPDTMADILSRGRILITSFGMTLFEARYLDVPVILLNHSRYHDRLAATLKEVYNLGYYGSISRDELPERLEAALKSSFRGDAGMSHCEIDDRGTERILFVIDRALRANRKGCFFEHGAYASLRRDDTHTLMVCRKCGDAFLYELEGPGDIYENGDYFLTEYEKQYGKSYIDDRGHISHMAEQRLNIIEHIIEKNRGKDTSSGTSRRLLDVGCALGFFLDAAKRRGWDAAGVEVSGFASHWAKEQLGVRVINSSFLHAPIVAENHDVITFFFVAEHFKDVEKVIERAYAALKRGGLLVCALPNVKGISARIDLKRFVQVHPKDHYFDTCPRNLARFLKKHGFRRCRVRITGIHPERFFKKLGLRGNTALLNAVYGAVARLFRLGDTFEYYGIKV
jgi:SAM-dependent methyltransferase